MNDSEWLPIGKVAERFEIQVPRLRTWCENGLIEYDRRNTGRWIPKNEFKKIERIITLFSQGSNITFDDVKEELIKDNLMNELKIKNDEDEKVEEMALMLEKAFEKSGAGDFFITVANQFQTMQQEISNLSKLMNLHHQNQTKLIEDNSKLDKLLKENSELKDLVVELTNSREQLDNAFSSFIKDQREKEKIQSDLEAKLDSIETQIRQGNDKKPGFFGRLFGG